MDKFIGDGEEIAGNVAVKWSEVDKMMEGWDEVAWRGGKRRSSTLSNVKSNKPARQREKKRMREDMDVLSVANDSFNSQCDNARTTKRHDYV